MGSFIQDLTDQVQGFKDQLASQRDDFKNLASTIGINVAPAAPAPPPTPKAPIASAGSSSTLILVALVVVGVLVWKKL